MGKLPLTLPSVGNLVSLRKIITTLMHKNSVVIVNSHLYSLSVLFAVLARITGNRLVLVSHGSAHVVSGPVALRFAVVLYEHINALVIRMARPFSYGVSVEAEKWLHHFGFETTGQLKNRVWGGQPM